MGMAFADAMVAHADVEVVLVDRRQAPGGHWLDAYPFVQLHQASEFYGVDSTRLGAGTVQQDGPEEGLAERASGAQIVAYFDAILRRLVASNRVRFFGGHDWRRDGNGHGDRGGDEHVLTSLHSGESVRVVAKRLVDATYLSPTVPATTPPPFGVADGARVVPVGELAGLGGWSDPPGGFVVVGSGKTATDAVVWLVHEGVAADQITWVRPREPWMLDRAGIQPDPVVALDTAAATMAAAAGAGSLDEMFLRLEAAGVVLRIDEAVQPTMAKTPTLGRWELDVLRTVERVVRLGHVRSVSATELVCDDDTVALVPGTVVVHCAADGLGRPPRVPIWQPDAIRPQSVRAGAPCFAAALIGLVEATRDNDAERNRVCPPNRFADDPLSWARMQVFGALATRAFGAEPDLAAWAHACLLNPARIPGSRRDDADVVAATARLAVVADDGLARMTELADLGADGLRDTSR